MSSGMDELVALRALFFPSIRNGNENISKGSY
jgi:hypothetical protein